MPEPINEKQKKLQKIEEEIQHNTNIKDKLLQRIRKIEIDLLNVNSPVLKDEYENYLEHSKNQLKEVDEKLKKYDADKKSLEDKEPKQNGEISYAQPQTVETLPVEEKKQQPGNSEIITKVIGSIVVALVGTSGFWQFLLSKGSDSKDCEINASPLVVERKIIEANQSMKVSIRADNPEGKPILYNWQAVNGQMNPSTHSDSTESTYTAPSKSVEDTISVDITLPGCKSVRRSHSISVKASSSSLVSPPFKIEPDIKKPNVIYPVFSGVCRDDWVTRAVNQVTGKPPKGQDDRGECNILLYGKGRWSTYDDLLKKVKEAFASFTPGVCRDDWVTKAVSQVTGRPPKGYGEVGECDMYLYNNGSWSDYPDLVSKVATTLHK